jgi:hypothetical protein
VICENRIVHALDARECETHVGTLLPPASIQLVPKGLAEPARPPSALHHAGVVDAAPLRRTMLENSGAGPAVIKDFRIEHEELLSSGSIFKKSPAAFAT